MTIPSKNPHHWWKGTDVHGFKTPYGLMELMLLLGPLPTRSIRPGLCLKLLEREWIWREYSYEHDLEMMCIYEPNKHKWHPPMPARGPHK